MSEITEQFTGAIRRGGQNRQPAELAGPEFGMMEEAHRGVMSFMAEMRDAAREFLMSYNEAAAIFGARTRLGWKTIPGRFDRPASEYGNDNGVPWLILTDLACGVDVTGFAFTRLEDAQRGYRLAGTGIIITGDGDEGVIREAAREAAGGLTQKMERYLERLGYR